MEKGFLNPDTFSQKYQWTTQDLKVCYMCLSNSDGTHVYTIINLNRLQVFTLPELWTGPLRVSDENKLWTGENYYDTETKLKQKKE